MLFCVAPFDDEFLLTVTPQGRAWYERLYPHHVGWNALGSRLLVQLKKKQKRKLKRQEAQTVV